MWNVFLYVFRHVESSGVILEKMHTFYDTVPAKLLPQIQPFILNFTHFKSNKFKFIDTLHISKTIQGCLQGKQQFLLK